MMAMFVCWLVCPPLWSRLKYLKNYWMDCYDPQRMDPSDFIDHPTFPLAPT